ncbi:MAG: hypothetical protein AAF641_00315 [Pseudomonadota bacterium]
MSESLINLWGTMGRFKVLSALAAFQNGSVFSVRRALARTTCVGATLGMLMSVGSVASAKQLPRPVVAITCDANLHLCRALVQVLAQKAPGRIFRINPEPVPDVAFEIRLNTTEDAGYLSWPDGSGDRVSRDGQDDVDFATRMIENASPGLESALNQHKNNPE